MSTVNVVEHREVERFETMVLQVAYRVFIYNTALLRYDCAFGFTTR
ncbi:MAG: hypothetical protein ACK4RS_01790 [Thiothrix sp.]